ncbi:Coiled-coil domain-containing protein 77 [Dipsacomyces acuminosporus]|nr:Coiled-coil domain-containing protein 77 [Dipsacomyces acuminosporus]
MEKEILRLYQERIDKYDEVFCEVSRDIGELKVTQQELTQLQWDNNKLSAEVSELRADIADLHRSLVKERQSHLDVVAENDALRVREHELERRVRILAAVSARYYGDNGSSLTRSGSLASSNVHGSDTEAGA